MIYHEVVQHSPGWFKMRLGLATASCFDKIVTPAKGDPSKQMDDYANNLIGELVTGNNAETFTSYWMERGQQFEADAAAAYEFITGFELDRGGFLTDDDMTVGASPDRRVIKLGSVVGGVEIKCPKEGTQVANLLRGDDIDPQYKPQVQGQILIGGFEFVDWFSYHPDFPPALIRTYRDDAYCNKLASALEQFESLLQEKIRILEGRGVRIPPRPIISLSQRSDDLGENILYAG